MADRGVRFDWMETSCEIWIQRPDDDSGFLNFIVWLHIGSFGKYEASDLSNAGDFCQNVEIGQSGMKHILCKAKAQQPLDGLVVALLLQGIFGVLRLI